MIIIVIRLCVLSFFSPPGTKDIHIGTSETYIIIQHRTDSAIYDDNVCTNVCASCFFYLYYCSPMHIHICVVYAWTRTYIYVYIFSYNIYIFFSFIRNVYIILYKSLSKCVQSLPPPFIADTIVTSRIIDSAGYL